MSRVRAHHLRHRSTPNDFYGQGGVAASAHCHEALLRGLLAALDARASEDNTSGACTRAARRRSRAGGGDGVASEFVFVVDRSGSVAGARLAAASDALVLVLSSLPARARVDVVGFGSHATRLRGACAPLDDSCNAAAVAHVRAIAADLGGTDVLRARRGLSHLT